MVAVEQLAIRTRDFQSERIVRGPNNLARDLPRRAGDEARQQLYRERGKEMTDFVKVAKADEINPGQARLIDVKGKQIAVFNINGDFFAIDNMCTHEEASLAEGEISGHEVTCPLHGAKFDVRTGEVLGPPAYDDVACYAVRVVGTDVEVDLG